MEIKVLTIDKIMKIIINEAQYNLLRRVGIIEDLFKEYVDDDEFIYRVLDTGPGAFGTHRITLDEFIPAISYTIAHQIAKNEMNPREDDDNDDFVTYRNQLQRFIQSNYYDYLKKRYKETLD